MLALEPLHAPITESYSVHDVSNKQTQITAAPRTPRHTGILYGNAKTLPKWRTREWHLANAAWAPSQPAQNQMQGRVVQAADTGADQRISSSRVRAWQRTPRDPAIEIEGFEEEGRVRTPGARTRAVRS